MGKLLRCLLVLSIAISQDNSQLPKEVVPFELYAHELPIIHDVVGKVLVTFIIDEEGNVNQAEIIDSFNVRYSGKRNYNYYKKTHSLFWSQ